MSESLTTVVSLSIAAAAKLSPSEVQIQLKSYGLGVEGFSAAASVNPEAALAGVLAGQALVALPQTTAITEAVIELLVAAGPFTGGAADVFALGLTVGAEYLISTGAAIWTADTINALASELGTANTQAAIMQGFAAYGQGELYNAQIEMDSSAAMWSAAGQALSSVGESLYNDIQSIGSYFPGLLSVSQNQNGTETIIINNENSSNNWTTSDLTFTQQQTVSSALVNYTNGTSQNDVYNPSPGVSEEISNYSGLNATGAITGQTLDLAPTAGSASDQATISNAVVNIPDGTQATLTGNDNTINGGNADTLTVDGTGNAATLGTDAMVTVNGDNNSLTLGNGGAITLLGTNTIFQTGDDGSLDLNASGDTAIITGVGMVVSASGDTVGTENNTNVTINGSGNTIDFWNGNASVTASGDTVQVGSANATEASLTGSNNTFTTWSSGTLFVSGTSDNMYMDSSGVVLVLAGPSMNVTPYTAGDDLFIEASTTATIDGSGETIQFSGESSYINVSGNNNVISNAGSGDTGEYIGLLGGSGSAITVNDSYIATWNDTSFSATGNADSIGAGSNDTIDILGGEGSLIDTYSSTITISNDTKINLYGNNDTVNVSAGSYVGIEGGTGLTVNGSNISLATTPNSSLNLSGGNDYVNLGGSGNYIGLLGGSGYIVNGSNSSIASWNGTSAKIYGNSDSLAFGSGSNIFLAGGSNYVINTSSSLIEAVPGVSMTVYGDNNAIYGNSITVDIIGNKGTVWGQGDTFASDGTGNANNNQYSIPYGYSSNPESNSGYVYDTASVNGGYGEDFSGYGGGYGFASGSKKKPTTWGIDQIAKFDRFFAPSSPTAAISPATSPGLFEGPMWKGKTITWSFASAGSSALAAFSGSINAPQYQKAIVQAFQTWAAASGLTFKEVPAAQGADIVIGWGNFDTSSSGILGFTNYAFKGDQMEPGVTIRLEDPSQDALLAAPGGQFDYTGTTATLYQVALHEIGHALGLSYDTSPNSIMNYSLGSSNQGLSTADISAINALYGPNASPVSNASAGISELIQQMAGFGNKQSLDTLTPIAPPNHQVEPVLAAALH